MNRTEITAFLQALWPADAPGLIVKGEEPRPVRVEAMNRERRYALAELGVGQAAPADSGPRQTVPGRGVPTESEERIVRRSLTYPEDPPDVGAITRECAWLAHCYADRARLSEPEWYAALSIVARAGDRELVHAWSREHPGYDPAETDRKAERARRDAGPRTCAWVAAELGDVYCRRCRHWGRVKSPIVLGRPRRTERPSEAQVSGALNALRDVVVDFPFRGQAHFAAWLAALLTPLARRPPDPGENTVTTVTPAWGGTRSHCQSWRVLAGIRDAAFSSPRNRKR